VAITIEKARPEDAVATIEYLKLIGRETNNLTFGSEGLPFTLEEEATYIANLTNSRDGAMFVAKDGDKIVGDASLNRLPRRMNHRGDIGVSVAREYWNRGIGSALLAQIIAHAREIGIEIIDLQVRGDNRAAIHLYEKFGFEKIGSHPAFYKIDGEYIGFDYMYLRLH